jgi:phage-related protein
MISEAIFKEEDKEPPEISYNTIILLQNPTFRQYIIEELILSKKNLTGSLSSSLNKLYEALKLNEDSLKKLQHRKFHLKAKGIQELAIMGQVKYEKEIFWLANHKNVLVRTEAQCALVSFSGFSGLRFLDVTEYPISEWQQIQLLDKLNGVKQENTHYIQKWLQSSNVSVIVFSLKLATFYNDYNIYESVISHLQHPDVQVKLNVLAYLKNMPREDTAEKIISNYLFDNKLCKLTILDALKHIGSESQVPFLLTQLNDEDDDIKAAAANTLSHLHPSGAAFLQTYLFADQHPWKAIFLQIEHKHAA